jgi:putative ATP-dependent endonuclease of the OLD family
MAKQENQIGELAARAAINQFLQPQINEMFFAQNVVFVEGDEDRSILSKYLQLNGKYPKLLTMGIHIVPTNGKGNMINALSIALGFKISFFAIFDGDMDDEREKEQAIKLNRIIMTILDYHGPQKNGSLDGHVIHENFCVWKSCFQDVVAQSVAKWSDHKGAVCREFGWTMDRLQKNAMVLEATLERVYGGEPIACLENLCEAIIKKFSAVETVATSSQ